MPRFGPQALESNNSNDKRNNKARCVSVRPPANAQKRDEALNPVLRVFVSSGGSM